MNSIDPLHPIAFSDDFVKQHYPFAYKIYKNLLPPLPKEKIVMEKVKFVADTWRTYSYKNIDFKLAPSVHQPGISSAMIFDYLYDADLAGKDIIIMGVGAGVEPVIAAKNNTHKVYAVDVNDKSVETTILNYNELITKKKPDTKTLLIPAVSDLFSDFAVTEPVDVITFNSPHTYVPLSDRDDINTNLSVGTTLSTRFFAQITQKQLLKKEGEIIFHLSNTAEMKKIMSYALTEGFAPELLRTIAYVNENDNISRHIFRFTYYDKK